MRPLRLPVPEPTLPPTILAVDDQPDNLELYEALLSEAGYRVATAASGLKALEMVEKVQPETILLDVMMPDLDGFEVCRRLKTSRRTCFIPVVIVTALADLESKIRGLEVGADDFLNKPIQSFELIARLRSLGRIRALRDELDSTESVLLSMVAALERKTPLSRDHSVRIAAVATAAARELELGPVESAAVAWGALLHDLGKIGVPEDALLAPKGSRSAEQDAQNRRHPEIGEEILRPLGALRDAADIVRHHHERLDGSGYPDGLRGDAFTIPIEIVAAAEAFEAERRASPAFAATWQRKLHNEVAAGHFRASTADAVLRAVEGLPGVLPEPEDLIPWVEPRQTGRIYVVDDTEVNREVLEAWLEEAGHEVEGFADGAELIAAVERDEPDLVLADVHMPGIDGTETCRRLKADPRFTYLPFVLVTAQDGLDKQAALELGADEFLLLPIDRHELLARVGSLLRLGSYHQDLEEHETVVLSLAGVLEAKDPYTRGHSARVGRLAKKLALHMELGPRLVESMETAGLLHDIGKVAVPQAILHKPGPLDDRELDIVKTHPRVGWEICKSLRSARPVLPVIRSHHEHWNGGGYPDSLRGKAIPLGARVLGLVDAWDALTSERPYREAMAPERAFTLLEGETERGKWDPEVFEAFRVLYRSGGLDD